MGYLPGSDRTICGWFEGVGGSSLVIVPKRCVKCPRCQSRQVRVSGYQSASDWLREFVGFRAIRCERCLNRFTAFAPKVEVLEAAPYTPPVDALALRPRHRTALRLTPLDEIQAIEQEWRQQIQPAGVVEETLCAQLTHATWHLRCLQQAERESIAAAARERCFNGETAISLMTWRRSAETAIETALQQLQNYRRLGDGEAAQARALNESKDLLALAAGADGWSSHRETAYSLSQNASS